jgi:uncharacterized UBP type Zn finger protein
MNSVLVGLYGCKNLHIIVNNAEAEIMTINNDSDEWKNNLELFMAFASLSENFFWSDKDLVFEHTRLFHKTFLEDNLRNNGVFRKGRQEDAIEFLMYLSERIKSSTEQYAFSASNTSNIRKVHVFFDDLLVDMRQITTCQNGHQSIKDFKELIHLNISDNETDLNRAISRHFRTEVFPQCNCTHHSVNSNCNAYSCGECRDYVAATKIWTIRRIPEILILGLKLFKYDMKTNEVNKLFI